jgi:hypothetical protein
LQETKKFAPVREQQWMLFLGEQMVRFAGSKDLSHDEWPSAKFAQRLRDEELSLPPDTTIDQAIMQTLRVIKACDERWYEENIEHPLISRFSHGFWVGVNIDGLPDDIAVSTGNWARGRTTDAIEHQRVALAIDLNEAAATLEWQAAQSRQQATRASSSELAADLAYDSKVRAGAAGLARKLTVMRDDKARDEAMVELLDTVYFESLELTTDITPATSTIVLEVARSIDSELVDSTVGAQFCTDIAVALRGRALGLHEGGATPTQRRIRNRSVGADREGIDRG